MTKPRLLIVEDEAASLSMLVAYFEKHQYRVYQTVRGDDAETILKRTSIDVVLLDINLPGKDGLSVMRDIRDYHDGGVILVTSAKEDIDKIVGLEMGADDYVTKPYNLRELGARVKNLIRRVCSSDVVVKKMPNELSRVVEFQGWKFDALKKMVTSPSAKQLKLTEGECRILLLMIENAGKACSRDFFMTEMKQREWTYSDRSIDVMIGRVRKKLSDSADMPSLISTVHGVGYKFIGELG